MLSLQASIGALNDIVDAPADAGQKPAKPIPSGRVGVVAARALVVGAAVAGLLLTVPSGPGLVVLAVLGLVIGYGYDLVAKGTPWSWAPFAVGIPLLPVFAWFGVRGSLPSAFGVLVPAAVLAGAGLAIANASADAGRDRATSVGSVAIRLGPRRAWAAVVLLQAAVGLIALASLWISATPAPAIVAAVASLGVVAVGVAIGRSTRPERLEAAWEVQAIGTALLGVSWLWGLVGTG
jgi:4-hydroxybenzoate polyprenyltransferase